MNIKNFIRSKARHLILSTLGQFAFPRAGVHIFCMHRIKDSQESIEQFRRLVKYLASVGKLARVEEGVEMIEKRVPTKVPTFAFTFDDGFSECYTHFAPVLEEFGVNACFFVNPNFAGGNEDYIKHFTEVTVHTPNKRPMTWEQLRELRSRGHVIGAHTLDHFCINSEDISELRHQIVDCKKVLEEKLGVPCDYFAFPYGQIKHTCKAGIDIACEAFPYVFSSTDYKHYFSFDGRVINRRHIESFWPLSHVKFFLNVQKSY